MAPTQIQLRMTERVSLNDFVCGRRTRADVASEEGQLAGASETLQEIRGRASLTSRASERRKTR